MKEVVIVQGVRTPIGSFMGSLSSFSAPALGAVVIKGLLEKTGIDPKSVDEVIMGNVCQAAIGQAPARQAAIGAGIDKSSRCMTVNKVCGSGLKAVSLANQAIALGEAETVIAGGMESMSNVPYYLTKARTGYRMGDGKLIDGMVFDGLWDPYNNIHMGNCGEACAKQLNISRARQDEYAVLSYKKALAAVSGGAFKDEIIPVEIKDKRGNITSVLNDEEPQKADLEKITQLKPAFDKEGTITVANASTINDGAAALLLMSKEKAIELNIKPIAKFMSYAEFAQDPLWFTTSPAKAISAAVKKANLKLEDINLFEINEAFALVAIAAIQELGIAPDKVNINGGACALGHPIGATGARILVSLLHAMKKNNVKYGVASLCIGGGEANATVVELI